MMWVCMLFYLTKGAIWFEEIWFLLLDNSFGQLVVIDVNPWRVILDIDVIPWRSMEALDMWRRSLDSWLSCYRNTIDIATLLRYTLVMVHIIIHVDVHGLAHDMVTC